MRRLDRQALIAWGTFLWAVTTHAQLGEKLNETAAERLFREARELMSRNKYSEACPKLAESQRLDPGAGTLLNLAYCYAQNGQTASAWATYLKTAESARRTGHAQREAFAQQAAAALEPELARIVIELPKEARVPGLQIRMDEIVVPEVLWEETIPVDPGTRAISVSAPGHEQWVTVVRVHVPQQEPLRVRIPPLRPAPATPADSAAQKPRRQVPSAAESSGSRLIPIVFGTGAAGLTSGTLVGIASIELDRDKQLRTVSIVSLLIGGVALGAGAVLLLSQPSTERTEQGNRSRLTVSAGVGGISVAGSF